MVFADVSRHAGALAGVPAVVRVDPAPRDLTDRAGRSHDLLGSQCHRDIVRGMPPAKLKGWTKDGREVELTMGEHYYVHLLLGRASAHLPTRFRACGWSTALATAARMDAEGLTCGCPMHMTESGSFAVTTDLHEFAEGLPQT